MSESRIWNAIRDKLSRGSVRLFRNEVGQALAIRHRDNGVRQKLIEECTELCRKRGGSAARVAYGLTKGSGDLIGPKSIVITPEMVGRRIAVFTSCETKFGKGALQDEQRSWMDFINGIGGIAFVARSVEEAQQELDKPFKGV